MILFYVYFSEWQEHYCFCWCFCWFWCIRNQFATLEHANSFLQITTENENEVRAHEQSIKLNYKIKNLQFVSARMTMIMEMMTTTDDDDKESSLQSRPKLSLRLRSHSQSMVAHSKRLISLALTQSQSSYELNSLLAFYIVCVCTHKAQCNARVYHLVHTLWFFSLSMGTFDFPFRQQKNGKQKQARSQREFVEWNWNFQTETYVG